MTGPVVPTPPAEVPSESVPLRDKLREDLAEAFPHREFMYLIGEMAAAIEPLVAERVRAARDEALREAERRIEAAAIEQTEGIGDPTGALFRTAMGRAARIVAELREATP